MMNTKLEVENKTTLNNKTESKKFK